MNRPATLVAVVGTATDIGKTWTSCALLVHLRRGGATVAARKPIQTFASGDTTTDAERLARATGEAPTTVCPTHRRVPLPMAPPMAADALGVAPFTTADLLNEIDFATGVDFGLVETVGGVRSPMTFDGDSATFVEALSPDATILVADAELGTINAVRTSACSLDTDATPLTVMLNRYNPRDDLHRRNRAWLTEYDHHAVATTIPELATMITTRSERHRSLPDSFSARRQQASDRGG